VKELEREICERTRNYLLQRRTKPCKEAVIAKMVQTDACFDNDYSTFMNTYSPIKDISAIKNVDEIAESNFKNETDSFLRKNMVAEFNIENYMEDNKREKERLAKLTEDLMQ
jgi:hypothetical protein